MRRLLNAVLFVLGALALYAVSAQLRTSVLRGDSVPNFFSYFTMESNIFAALVLIFTPRNSALRGAATLYMTMTGVIYVLILARTDHSLPLWINVILHYIMPTALLATWIADPPELHTSYAVTLFAWLVYPCAYACYSLVRGSSVHWYPYGFLDPRASGAIPVAVAILAIALFASLVAYGLAWYAKHRRMAPQRT